MEITEPVRRGLAVQLARLAHFADLDLPEAAELRWVGHWLFGPVADPVALWERVHDDAVALWHLIDDDWDDRDLDDLPAAEWFPGMTPGFAEDARYALTRGRLETGIEHAVWLARYDHAEGRRGTLGRTLIAGGLEYPPSERGQQAASLPDGGVR